MYKVKNKFVLGFIIVLILVCCSTFNTNEIQAVDSIHNGREMQLSLRHRGGGRSSYGHRRHRSIWPDGRSIFHSHHLSEDGFVDDIVIFMILIVGSTWIVIKLSKRKEPVSVYDDPEYRNLEPFFNDFDQLLEKDDWFNDKERTKFITVVWLKAKDRRSDDSIDAFISLLNKLDVPKDRREKYCQDIETNSAKIAAEIIPYYKTFCQQDRKNALYVKQLREDARKAIRQRMENSPSLKAEKYKEYYRVVTRQMFTYRPMWSLELHEEFPDFILDKLEKSELYLNRIHQLELPEKIVYKTFSESRDEGLTTFSRKTSIEKMKEHKFYQRMEEPVNHFFAVQSTLSNAVKQAEELNDKDFTASIFNNPKIKKIINDNLIELKNERNIKRAKIKIRLTRRYPHV